MFDEIQTKLFNKGYGAYREIIQFVIDNRDLGYFSNSDNEIGAAVLVCDIDILKILFHISDLSHHQPTDDEKEYICSLIESQTVLKSSIVGYAKLLSSMTPKNYQPVKKQFENMTSELPAAILIAAELEKNGISCYSHIVKLFRWIMNSYVAISNNREKSQSERVALWNARFGSYAKQQNLSAIGGTVHIDAHDDSSTDAVKKHLEDKLKDIVGLDSVKDFIRVQFKMQQANNLWKENGKNIDSAQTLNMVFTGNPGTGKTMMARIVGELFRDLGILQNGNFVEASQSDLIAQYVGQTTKKTTDLFMSAIGGVLFIDEAYALTNAEGGYGQECIDTLIKLVDDHRGELLVILAGYPHEMADFLKSNSGLESRFPKELRINFPDYSEHELCQTASLMIRKKGFRITPEAFEIVENEIALRKKSTLANGGNARMVRNLIEEIIRNQSVRIVDTACSPDDLDLITADDIESSSADQLEFDLEATLSTVVGLEPIKAHLRSLNALLKIQTERKAAGLPVNETQTLHSVFKGNPGTGKTMMARIYAKVLHSMGYAVTDTFIEVDRSELIAEYIGQTAPKTKDVIESAVGGVLFIDEAYSLLNGGNSDYGKEAIDTLVKFMDEYKDRLVVIIAGYSNEMDSFLESNPGLKSRFPNILEFTDYTANELFQIAENKFSEQAYVLDDPAKEAILSLIKKEMKSKGFGNGRFIRNLFEKVLNAQALRLSSNGCGHSVDELQLITKDDINAVHFTEVGNNKPRIGF